MTRKIYCVITAMVTLKKKKDEKKNNKEEKKKEECNFVPRAQNSFEFPAVVHFAQDCSRREFSSC